MDGKDERLELVMTTLRVLAKHGKAKLDQQIASKAKTTALQLARSEAAAIQNAAQLLRQENALRKQIGGLEGRLERVVDAGKETPDEVS
jgi:ABC-type transporter Mla subunit MlaD